MPTTNDSSVGGSGTNGFFSFLEDASKSIAGTVQNVRTIFGGEKPQPSLAQPTFLGEPSTPSTAPNINVVAPATNYTPFIIGGAIILAVLLLNK